MKLVLGLAGEIASGKGTTAKYLEEKYGASTHRFSTMLRDILDRMYLDNSRENMQKTSTMFRQNFGEDTLAKVIFKDVENDNHEIIAVDGVRREADIAYLKKSPNFKLLYLEADIKTRYERLVKRGENSDDAAKTFEEFKRDHEGEAELKIKDLKNIADFVVDNNGTFEELYKQVDEIITNLKKQI